jgi:hypothetical protein
MELRTRNERLDTMGWFDNMSSAFCRVVDGRRRTAAGKLVLRIV